MNKTEAANDYRKAMYLYIVALLTELALEKRVADEKTAILRKLQRLKSDEQIIKEAQMYARHSLVLYEFNEMWALLQVYRWMTNIQKDKGNPQYHDLLRTIDEIVPEY